MYSLNHRSSEFLDQDTAIRQVLEATDRGLFDTDEDFEEDFEPARPSQTIRQARRRPAA